MGTYSKYCANPRHNSRFFSKSRLSVFEETIMKHFAFLRLGSTRPETQIGSLILILTDGSMNKNEQFEHETPFKIRMLKTDILKFKMH